VWQGLYNELRDKGLMVITVAQDIGGVEVARQWIEAAKPAHPALVDQSHLVSELYDMVNVPTAVWIDEDGNIVRGPEPAGAEDSFRQMDRTTYAMPEAATAAIRTTQRAYLEALRDWVANGPASRYIAHPNVPAGSGETAAEAAVAAAEFQMGEYLYGRGEPALAQRHFEEAKRLRPESWTYKRQAWALEDPMKSGGPEFWAAVDALGDRPYYPATNLEGPA
ncbi:MAG: redoxin domain-containing (seleno)protein, partial [Anaerolineales bacterium]